VISPKTAVQKSGIRVVTAQEPIEQLLEKEWLLTNGRGGYASSTVVGCNTRRYHGLLIGSFDNPANRILALANCHEIIFLGSVKFDLSTFEFPGGILPNGYLRIKGFSRDFGAHFHYEIGELRLTKSVYLLRERNTVAIVYAFEDVDKPLDFVIRPLAAMRDFHSLQNSSSHLVSSRVGEGVLVHHASPDLGYLLLNCRGAVFEEARQWWYNFVYRADRERGQDFTEDLFSPGIFKCRIDSPERVVLWADLGRVYKPGHFVAPDIEYVIQRLSEHHSCVVDSADDDEMLGKLYQAGDQFVVKRRTLDSRPRAQDAGRTTIFAGYPWFADWGRDAFISLPGLLLATRRFDEAKSVLLTFALAANQGVIPNRFDDYSNTAHFNSVDASLWFINAAFAWLNACGDLRTFQSQLLPTIVSIIDSFQHGTSFGIRADHDGLITAGDLNTQLTWMDAKYDGVAFTPRHGKPVEVNALWYNALMLLVNFLTPTASQSEAKRGGGDFVRLLDTMKSRAAAVKKSFNVLFWNETWGWLNDCISPDGAADATLRPNQIFAVSLPFSPIGHTKQKAIVDIVEKKLLTPYGLRSLSPDDSRYYGVYTGPRANRDRAYHQGTVWPYLIGPFVEAYLKVYGDSPKIKQRARTFIEPLLKRLTEAGCIGQVSEIFDADYPHKPKGCFAQAWSVAELIRAYLMVKE
jgi:predicted glycogen debranching enzyme